MVSRRIEMIGCDPINPLLIALSVGDVLLHDGIGKVDAGEIESVSRGFLALHHQLEISDRKARYFVLWVI